MTTQGMCLAQTLNWHIMRSSETPQCGFLKMVYWFGCVSKALTYWKVFQENCTENSDLWFSFYKELCVLFFPKGGWYNQLKLAFYIFPTHFSKTTKAYGIQYRSRTRFFGNSFRGHSPFGIWGFCIWVFVFKSKQFSFRVMATNGFVFVFFRTPDSFLSQITCKRLGKM